MNRFVKAAGQGAIVWLIWEGVFWAGEKIWRAVRPETYCDDPACVLNVGHGGPCAKFKRPEPPSADRVPSPADQPATPSPTPRA